MAGLDKPAAAGGKCDDEQLAVGLEPVFDPPVNALVASVVITIQLCKQCLGTTKQMLAVVLHCHVDHCIYVLQGVCTWRYSVEGGQKIARTGRAKGGSLRGMKREGLDGVHCADPAC